MRSAIACGRRASDRITASPRKMCVPGVQAYAGAGVAARRSTATHTTHSATTIGCLTDSRPGLLDPDALSLAAHRFAQIRHLFAHHVVDRLARGIDVIPNGIHDVIDWQV